MEPQTSAELPAYADVTSPAPSREPVTHSDSLGGEHGGKPFATLNIVSRAASANNQPVGYEGQPIVGSVDLNVEKETAFEAITVTVNFLLTNGFDNYELKYAICSLLVTSWLGTISALHLSRLPSSYGPRRKRGVLAHF